MSEPVTYCRNCGTKLNGQVYCHNCQKPTGESEQHQNSTPLPAGKSDDRKSRKRLFKGLAVSFLLVIGLYFAVAGIVIGVDRHRRHEHDVQEDATRRIEQASDEYVKRHLEDPCCASEWGWRLSLRAGDGLPNPITTFHDMAVYQKRNDEAGQILLEALEGYLKDKERWDKLYGGWDGCYIHLSIWQKSVLNDPEISNRYWEDADFRLRVETALGKPTSNLKFE